MSDTIIATIITGVVTLITVLWTSKTTRDKVTQELDKKTALQQQEIDFIKTSMDEMKADIKTHNNYARLFSETMPVVQEQIKYINQRIEDLEKKAG